jgi:hypothetical protein
MAINKTFFGIICTAFIFNVINAQSNHMLLHSTMLPIRESDSIGEYDIECIVLGVVALDSLIGITYWYKEPFPNENTWFKLQFKKVQFSTGMFFTQRRNIPLNRSITGENIDLLIRNKDYFLMENRCGVIMEYIYPRCNEEGKKRLEETLLNCSMVYDVAYMPPLDSSWKDVIKSKSIKGKEYIEEAFFYDAYRGKNEYLLVIMNKKWTDSLVYVQSDPMRKTDCSNLYVKYLIPLKPINK